MMTQGRGRRDAEDVVEAVGATPVENLGGRGHRDNVAAPCLGRGFCRGMHVRVARLPDSFPETLIEIGSKGAVASRKGLIRELSSGAEMEQIDVDPPVLDWASQQWHMILRKRARHLRSFARRGAKWTLRRHRGC